MRWHNAAEGADRGARRWDIARLLVCLACVAVSLANGQRGIAQDIEAHHITTSTALGWLHFAFSPDGKILVFREKYGGMKLWDLDKDKEWKATHGILVSKESSLRNGKKFDLLIGKGGDLLWEGDQNSEEVDRRGVMGMAFSPDGKSLALGCDFGVLFFDIATGKENSPAILSWGPGKVPFAAETITFSPDGETLATWNEDGETILWDLIKRKMRARIPMWNRYHVCPLSFSPNGKTVAGVRSLSCA